MKTKALDYGSTFSLRSDVYAVFLLWFEPGDRPNFSFCDENGCIAKSFLSMNVSR